MAVPNPLPPTAGATVVGGNPPIDLNLTSAAPYSSSSTATAAVPTTSPKLNLPNGLPSPTTAPNASRHRHSLSNAPRPVDLGPGSHPNPTSSMDHHHHHHHHPQPQTTSATSTVDGPYAGYPGGGKGKERAPSPWRTSTDEEKGLSGPAKDGSSRSVLFEGTMNGGRTTAKEAGRMNGGYAGPGGTGTSSEDVLAWASYAVGRLRATFDHASSSSSSSTLRRSPPLSSSRSPLLSPSGLHRPFYPSWPRLPSANRLRHWSTRLSPLLSVLALVYLTYRLVFTVLDSPTTLHLDPTIDPLTFKLLPPGDPTHSISDNPLDAPLAAALAADRAERDALVNAQPFDEPRAFWKGDQGLRDNRPAHRFGCDDGRAGRRKGSLLFLGIFTTPGSLAKRQILRTLFRSDLPPAPTPGEPPLIDLTFVSARPPNDNWRWLLERERDLYGDVEWLEAVPENIDTGKTAHFFKWVSEGAGGRWEGKQGGDSRDPRNGPVGRPQFVMKVDDDVGPLLALSRVHLLTNAADSGHLGTGLPRDTQPDQTLSSARLYKERLLGYQPRVLAQVPALLSRSRVRSQLAPRALPLPSLFPLSPVLTSKTWERRSNGSARRACRSKRPSGSKTPGSGPG